MKLFFLLLISCFVLSGCTNKYESYITNNIAEIRQFLMEGETEGVKASLICGKREKDYVINGYATDNIEFGVLTFKVEGIEDYDVSIANFVLLVGTIRYDGALLQNPFDSTLVYDIGKIIDSSEKVVAKLVIGEYVKEIELNNICKEWKVDYNRVVKIISKDFKSELDEFVKEGVFEGEIYIKILNDADIYKGDYYWYVNIVSRGGNSISFIMSPHTEEILARSDNFTVE